MNVEAWGMTGAGVVALGTGVALARPRFQEASGAAKAVVLGPVFYAVALAMFSAEHFTAARDLAPIVPHWLGWPLFWTYMVGAAWSAGAASLITGRQVRWSAALSALLLLIIVITIDVPNLPREAHSRLFWILLVRETSFAGGAVVLAGAAWGSAIGSGMARVGRSIVGVVAIFYAVEHFLHPLHVPGVPLEKMTPAWIPAPAVIACVVGVVLLASGVGLLIPRMTMRAAALGGMALVMLTAMFYVPIAVLEFRTPLAVEGLNYVGDTLLYAATLLLAGTGALRAEESAEVNTEAPGALLAGSEAEG